MLSIRLRRMGARNAPFYRVVVSDSRKVPTASAVEEIGHYDPRRNPSAVTLDHERLDYWVGRGARMSPTVARLARGSAPAAAASAPPAAAAAAPSTETAEAT
jgi:small subunit ribosomal protein S16